MPLVQITRPDTALVHCKNLATLRLSPAKNMWNGTCSKV
jgi:hypothetical protein